MHSPQPGRDLPPWRKICPHAGGVLPARTDSGTQPPGKGPEKSQAWFLATNQWAGTPAGSGLREEALRRKLVLQDWGRQHGVMGST